MTGSEDKVSGIKYLRREDINMMKKTVMIGLCSILLLSPVFRSKAQENSLTYMVNKEGEAVITGCQGVEKEITIPDVIDGYPVVGIEEGAFQDRTYIKKVNIQSGVRYIGEAAFSGCSKLEEIKLGEGLQYIAGSAFYEAESLGEVILPESTVYVGENAFGNCTGLAQIEYPQAAHIDGYAFEGSLWQKERDDGKFRIRGSILIEALGNKGPILEIPYGVTETINYAAEDSALFQSELLGARSEEVYEEVILPDTLTNLGTQCFYGIQVRRIEIPYGVKWISKWAFALSGLEEIVLPEGLEGIEGFAFCKCEKLKEINIPDTVETIGLYAFNQCDGLSTVTIPGSVRLIEMLAFSYCDNLEKIILEEGVEEVSGSFVDYCDSLDRIQFPESLKHIEGWMRNTSLKRVYIPGEAEINIDDDIISDYNEGNYCFTVYSQEGSRAQEVAELLGLKFVEVENGNEMP